MKVNISHTILLNVLLIKHFCYYRVQKSIRRRKENYPATSEALERKELRKASVLIWISILFIFCQSVKIIPDFYEALYCNHKEVCSQGSTFFTKALKYLLLQPQHSKAEVLFYIFLFILCLKNFAAKKNDCRWKSSCSLFS